MAWQLLNNYLGIGYKLVDVMLHMPMSHVFCVHMYLYPSRYSQKTFYVPTIRRMKIYLYKCLIEIKLLLLLLLLLLLFRMFSLYLSYQVEFVIIIMGFWVIWSSLYSSTIRNGYCASDRLMFIDKYRIIRVVLLPKIDMLYPAVGNIWDTCTW